MEVVGVAVVSSMAGNVAGNEATTGIIVPGSLDPKPRMRKKKGKEDKKNKAGSRSGSLDRF